MEDAAATGEMIGHILKTIILIALGLWTGRKIMEARKKDKEEESKEKH